MKREISRNEERTLAFGLLIAERTFQLCEEGHSLEKVKEKITRLVCPNLLTVAEE